MANTNFTRYFATHADRRRHRRAHPLCALVALLCSLSFESVSAADVSYMLSMHSDYVFRGVSQTRSGPSLQASIDIDTGAGWYGYLWASNVDYVEPPEPDDGARSEWNLLVGYNQAINDRLQADISWVQYLMPGTTQGIDYDYSEWTGSITVDDRHTIAVSYAGDVMASGEAGWHYLAGSSFALPLDTTMELSVGHVDLRDAYGDSYEYGALSLARALGRFEARLDYVQTSSSARRIFEQSLVRPRAVVSISVAFD